VSVYWVIEPGGPAVSVYWAIEPGPGQPHARGPYRSESDALDALAGPGVVLAQTAEELVAVVTRAVCGQQICHGQVTSRGGYMFVDMLGELADLADGTPGSDS
jgi:hypothetical protein